MLRHPFFTLNLALAALAALTMQGIPGPVAVGIVVVGVVLLGLIWRTSSPGPSNLDPVKYDDSGIPIYPVVSLILQNGQLHQTSLELKRLVQYDSPAKAVEELRLGLVALVTPADVEKVIALLARR